MSLYRVTITGADDAVSPWELMSIAVDFPFVEWALLLSKSRAGTPRYPSVEWVRRFAAAKAGSRTVPLAAHLCGENARAFMRGERGRIDLADFGRVQVNGWESSARHMMLGQKRPFELILQARGDDHLKSCIFDAAAMQNTGILYDPSGGRGMSPFGDWPKSVPGLRIGFAGGIAVDNVVDVLMRIGERPEPYWIDLESGARNAHDAFDLARVRHILELARPFVRPDEGREAVRS